MGRYCLLASRGLIATHAAAEGGPPASSSSSSSVGSIQHGTALSGVHSQRPAGTGAATAAKIEGEGHDHDGHNHHEHDRVHGDAALQEWAAAAGVGNDKLQAAADLDVTEQALADTPLADTAPVDPVQEIARHEPAEIVDGVEAVTIPDPGDFTNFDLSPATLASLQAAGFERMLGIQAGECAGTVRARWCRVAVGLWLSMRPGTRLAWQGPACSCCVDPALPPPAPAV